MQRVADGAAEARGPGIVVDAVLLVALLNEILQAQFVWDVAYSPTRAIFISYLLFGFALLGRFWRQVGKPVTIAICVVFSMVVLGQLSWVAQQSWLQADNYWQDWRLMAGYLAFGAAFGRRHWAAWSRILVWLGVGVAVLQALALVFGGSGLRPKGPEGFYDFRPLAASTVLLILVAFVILVLDSPLGPGWTLGAGLFTGISVIIGQHRSAWVSLMIALILCGIHLFRQRAGWQRWGTVIGVDVFWALAIVVPLVSGLYVLPGSRASGSASGGLPTTATSTGTFEWRLEMWNSRINVSRSIDDVLFGGTFGVTPALGPGAQVMNPFNSAHNLVLDQFIMLGLVGLLAIGAILFVALWWTPDRLGPIPVLLWALLGFGVFYNWPSWAWLLAGAGASLSSAGAQRQLRRGDTSDNAPGGPDALDSGTTLSGNTARAQP